LSKGDKYDLLGPLGFAESLKDYPGLKAVPSIARGLDAGSPLQEVLVALDET
jgi:hypothetical protein